MKREITSAITLPFLVALIYFGSPLAFYLFALIAILICTWEYFKLVSNVGIDGYPAVGIVLSALLTLCFYLEGRFLLEWMICSLLALFAYLQP